MRADAFIKYIFSTTELTVYLYEKKKKFQRYEKKASSQSTHIYLKNHSYLGDIIRHLSVKCFNVAAAVYSELSDHTLSQGRVFQEAFKPERIPVEPGCRVLLDIK